MLSCNEAHRQTRLSVSLADNPLYPIIRSSPSNGRRRGTQHTGTPQSHRGSPVALASRFERNSSLRGSGRNHARENGICHPELEPLMCTGGGEIQHLRENQPFS